MTPSEASSLDGARRVDLNGYVGTELRGVQLADLADPEIEMIRSLVAERGVLVFPDQDLDVAAQANLCRRFGDLMPHPREVDGQHPEALRIQADASSSYADGDNWHSDHSWCPQPPSLSMLRIDRAPPIGGDTAFASTYQALDSLSERMKDMLDSLSAVHAYTNLVSGPYPSSTHPVSRTHPLNGRKALFVNFGYTQRIVELSLAESSAVLRMLFDHIAYGVSFQCRVRWAPGTVALWDNRCTQHHASWDYFPKKRSGWRVTIAGETPV